MSNITITINEEETILLRDAIINYKHELKHSPSERGQKLCKIASALGPMLDAQINNRRF